MGKQIILIGGMPTAGKSTIALTLSKHLGLPWISTDQIGTVMRAVASRARHHDLFTWQDRDDFQYLEEQTAREIADGEFAKGEAVWPGVRKLIDEDYTWADGFIIEGDDVLPHRWTEVRSSLVVSGADSGKCLDCRSDAPMNLGIDVRLYGYGTAWPRGGVT